MAMPDVDWVFYYPHPDLPHNIVGTTTIYPFSSAIHLLWDLVIDQNPHLGTHISKAPCTFYFPSDLSVEPLNTLYPRCQEWLRQHRDDGPKAEGAQLVNDYIPDRPHPRLVHFVVVTDEILEDLDYRGDLEGRVLRLREKGIKSFRSTFPTPSSGVSSIAGVRNVVVDNADRYHAGRPALNCGPPVSLFNHALGRFNYDLSHLDNEPSEIDTSPHLIQLAHTFIDLSASYFYNEDARVGAISNILEQSGGVPLLWGAHRFDVNPDAINFGDPPFVIVEVKNEAGLEGDASMQAALSYAHIATSLMAKDPWKLSNYPAVIYGIMGNVLEIGVAMYTDGVYYNLLFSQRLHLGFHSAKNIIRLARAFAATRRVIGDLRRFYARLKATSLAQCSMEHLFPSPLPIPTYSHGVPSLTFTRRMSQLGETFVLAEDQMAWQSCVYLATMSRPHSAGGDTEMSSSVDALADTVEVVVKFAAQYHPEAHRLLAAAGLAPTLHACVPICGGLFMVVMDCVQGKMAWEAGSQGMLLSYGIFKDVQDAVALLHSKNLVFGDLRTPNIMVVPSRSGLDTLYRGMLVDFEWVGTHGISRYPANLDAALSEWASVGIEPYGIMDKAHDLEMMDKFKDVCHSI